MRALQVTGNGGLDSLRLNELPKPAPGPGEIVVKVTAASLNHRDLTMSKGAAPGTPEPPFTLMSDCAGVVHAVGAGVTAFRPGDRVSSLFFQLWTGGRIDAKVRWATVPSIGYEGVASEYVLLKETGAYSIPDSLSDHDAATLPCAALTAWRAMFEDAALEKGAKVLIQGTGGVAIFALQFAVAAGLEAIVTSSSDKKLDRAKALGAAHGINYRTHPQWGAEVKKLVGSAGVDFVLGVGGSGNLAQSLDAVALGGHIAIIGMLGGVSEELPFRALVGKNAKLQGVSVGSAEMYGRMIEFITAHDIAPVIDSVYPLAQGVDAFRALAGGGHFGKIVIDFTA